MDNIIEQLASGNVMIQRPEVHISEERISIEIETGLKFTGKLIVSSLNECSIEGSVYSTSNYMTIMDDKLTGVENTIDYTLDVQKIAKDLMIEGEFQIVTNGGEFIVPYAVKVVPTLLDTSIGRIGTIEQYVELIDSNVEEAVALFRTEDFQKIMIANDTKLQHIYKCITNNNQSRKSALQEFLLAIGIHKQIHPKKEAIQSEEVAPLNKVARKQFNVQHIKKKKNQIQILNHYIDFRMGILNDEQYLKQSVSTIDKLMHGLSYNDGIEYRLYKIHIHIIAGRLLEADKLLSNLDEIHFEVHENKNIYAYYLYIKTLKEKSPEVTHVNLSIVKNLYRNGHGTWQILWCLLYLDSHYKKDQRLKYSEIHKQFEAGCTSPILYFEAITVLNEEPTLLKKLDVIERRFLLWGAKKQFINKPLADYIVHIANNEKNFHKRVYKILEHLYLKFKDKEFLMGIIGTLIKGNVVNSIAHKWYALGVLEDIKITELYEYYMHTIDRTRYDMLPRVILLYFIYNSNMNDSEKGYLYANIIINRDKDVSIYSSYMKNIENFVVDQVNKNNINYNLSIIYDHVLAGARITKAIAKNLPTIIFKHEITCSDNRIKAIAIKHKQSQDEEIKLLTEKKAVIDIYTEDYTIIFIDADNKRYINIVDYTVKKLMDAPRYAKRCIDLGTENKQLLYYLMNRSMNRKLTQGTLGYATKLVQFEGIEEQFKQELLFKLIEYYYDVDKDIFEEYLLMINVQNVTRGERITILEYYLEQKMYNIALNIAMRYDYERLDIDKLVDMTNNLIKEYNYEKHNSFDSLTYYLLNKQKITEIIIKYLVDNFRGSIYKMIDIWKIAKIQNIYDVQFSEKLLSKSLNVDIHNESIEDIFEFYYEHNKENKIVQAYLTKIAYDYIAKGKNISNKLFKIMKDMFEHNHGNRCIEIALLKMYSSLPELHEDELRWCEKAVRRCIFDDVVLPYFKNFHNHFLLPNEVGDKVIVEHRAVPNSKIYLCYRFNHDSNYNHFKQVEMKEVFPGIYTYSIMLFYNEKLYYYIDGLEQNSDEEKQVKVVENAFVKIEGYESGLDLINMMIMSRQMNDDETLEAMLHYYANGIMNTKNIYKPI